MNLIHRDFTVVGFDVSHWQGPIDWDLAGQKAFFAIIRIGDGISGGTLDSKWKYNWTNAKNKLVRGAYWFYRANVDPLLQVEWIAEAYKQVGNDFGEMGFYIDLEKDGSNMSKTNYTSRLVKFLVAMDELLKTFSPKVPLAGIYTSYGWWDERVDPAGVPKLSKRTKWTAQWFYNATENPTRLPNGWRDWQIWQLTARGNAKEYIGSGTGVGKVLDLNVFNSRRYDIYKYFGIDPVLFPPPVVEPPGTVVGFRPFGVGMNVRNKPTTVNSKILLKTTTEVLPVVGSEIDANGSTWYIIGGNDTDKLYINSTTGEPIFK